jgi:hypothetical protein
MMPLLPAQLRPARGGQPGGRSKISRPSWRIALALVAAAFAPAPASAQIWDFPQPHPVGDLNVSTQIVLRFVTGVYAAPPAPVAVTVPTSSTIEFSTPLTGAEVAGITWFKDGEPLPATAKTLVIANATAADAGVYTAQVQRADSTPRPGEPSPLFSSLFEQVRIRVTNSEPQTLAALSTRATLDASNPMLIGGFVLSGDAADSRSTSAVLIRAVGPSLAELGVSRPLAAPIVTLFDAQGAKIPWPDLYIPEFDPYQLARLAAPHVGAFPLQAGRRDFAILQFLPPGAYTAQVSSGDEAGGDVVLEVYEVSRDVLAKIAPDFFAPPLVDPGTPPTK